MKKKQMKASLLLASLLTLGFSVTGCTNDDYDFDQIDAIDLIEKPELLKEAKEEHQKRLKGGKYECPIPKGVKPRIISAKK